MILLFPDFNIYSTPLLVLVVQGVLFAVLLLHRFVKESYIPDLLLGILLLVTCWQRSTYTIGFMGWYDVFRNTKINYFLLNMTLVLGPLLYLYVKSVTVSKFRFVKRHLYHFIPALIFILYRIGLYLYDANQPGFADTQNGYLMSGLDSEIISPIFTGFNNIHLILYLAFTFQVLYHYKAKITQYYSNTYELELNWLRNFLYIYTFLYVYSLIQLVVNVLITDMHWTQKWWYHFFSGLAIIYVGIKGYFTKTSSLSDLAFDTFSSPVTLEVRPASTGDFVQDIAQIQSYFAEHKPYLNPDLNLSTLASDLGYPTNQLSEIVNSGIGKNFNDFINGYRVEEVKAALLANKHKTMSLVGIAMDAGFNSKPTFNRVFKKLAGISPSQYITNNL